MITWRGWGLLVMVIGLVPFLFTVPMLLDIDPVAPGSAPPSLTGYFVFPLLVSAGLTFGLDRLLRRVRADQRLTRGGGGPAAAGVGSARGGPSREGFCIAYALNSYRQWLNKGADDERL